MMVVGGLLTGGAAVTLHEVERRGIEVDAWEIRYGVTWDMQIVGHMGSADRGHVVCHAKFMRNQLVEISGTYLYFRIDVNDNQIMLY